VKNAICTFFYHNTTQAVKAAQRACCQVTATTFAGGIGTKQRGASTMLVVAYDMIPHRVV
jgi:hypothetical protein